jgi:hypothetical protein
MKDQQAVKDAAATAVDDPTETTDDTMGTANPEPREDQLGEATFGDDKADNAGDPKIVDYPENSEDITEDISS